MPSHLGRVAFHLRALATRHTHRSSVQSLHFKTGLFSSYQQCGSVGKACSNSQFYRNFKNLRDIGFLCISEMAAGSKAHCLFLIGFKLF